MMSQKVLGVMGGFANYSDNTSSHCILYASVSYGENLNVNRGKKVSKKNKSKHAVDL